MGGKGRVGPKPVSRLDDVRFPKQIPFSPSERNVWAIITQEEALIEQDRKALEARLRAVVAMKQGLFNGVFEGRKMDLSDLGRYRVSGTGSGLEFVEVNRPGGNGEQDDIHRV